MRRITLRLSKNIFLVFGLALFLCLSLSACAPAKPKNPNIILATTTSTQDSGLLDELIPVFEGESGYVVKIIAVGTGKALTMGREGNADVLLVHAPSAEKDFMDGGYGEERFLIMHNDFVVVGPASDPAGVNGMSDPLAAMERIAIAESTWISRGDDSGTNKKELAFWEQIGLNPKGEWFLESGQGMGATLKIASEKDAYTLTDRATYLFLKENLFSEIVVEGHESLLNVYHTMTVNPEIWEHVNNDGAKALANFLISDETQDFIEEYGVDIFGQPLFFPDADKTDADLGLE
ncbi:substrate-binding domain-containing protein [Chloroflexota bacterium]